MVHRTTESAARPAFGARLRGTSIVMIPWVALGVMYLLRGVFRLVHSLRFAVNLPFLLLSAPGHGCSGSTSGNCLAGGEQCIL